MKKTVIIGLIFLKTTTILACSCIGTSTIKNSLKSCDFVFIGKVISAEKVHLLPETTHELFLRAFEYQKMKFTFEVSTIYKGKIKSDTIAIYSGFGGGDCGYEFIIGNNYIVYAKWDKHLTKEDFKTPIKFLETNSCRRTRPVDKDEILAIEKYAKPRKAKN